MTRGLIVRTMTRGLIVRSSLVALLLLMSFVDWVTGQTQAIGPDTASLATDDGLAMGGHNATDDTFGNSTDGIPSLPPNLLIPPGANSPNATMPPTSPDGCYTSMDDIFYVIADDGKLFTEKTFVLCPNSVIDVGYILPGQGISNGQAPLVPRSNTEFLCGDDGKSENNCILRGGDFGLAVIPVIFDQDTAVNNVVIRGFTFEGQDKYSFYAVMPGSIRLEDCIFRDNSNSGPVVLDYSNDWNGGARRIKGYDSYADKWDFILDYIDRMNHQHEKGRQIKVEEGSQNNAVAKSKSLGNEKRVLQPDTLEVVFNNCLFSGNKQIERQVGVFSGVVTVMGGDHNVVFENCNFKDNIYGSSDLILRGYAIFVSQAEISIIGNCFINNDFLGQAPIVLEMTADPTAEGSEILQRNYATTNDDNLQCTLAAYAATEADIESFRYKCVGAQVAECGSDKLITERTEIPTPTPTPKPTPTSVSSGIEYRTSLLSTSFVMLLLCFMLFL